MASSVATCSGAPPLNTRSSRYLPASPGAMAASIVVNIVGTPMNSVHPCFSIRSSARAASNRRISTTDAPASRQVPSPQMRPNEWCNGRPPSRTSSAVTPNGDSLVTMMFIVTLRWVSIAPLGRPVVPDV
ncbi:hypothetical protein GCM10027610_060420 [Dactylosporangium cerinum]